MFHPPFGRSSLEPTTRILGRRPWADSLRPSLSCHGATCRQSDSTCTSSFSHSPWFILSRTQWKAWIVIIMLLWFLEGKQVTSLNNVMNLGSHCLAKAQSHWSRCYDLGVCTVWHLQCDVCFFFSDSFWKLSKTWPECTVFLDHFGILIDDFGWFFDIFGHIWTFWIALFVVVSWGSLPVPKPKATWIPRCYTFPKTRRMVADTFAGHGLKEFKDWSL